MRAFSVLVAAVTLAAQPLGQSEQGLIKRFQATVGAALVGATLQQVREGSPVSPDNLLEWKLRDGSYVTVGYYTVEPGKARVVYETHIARISVPSLDISGFGDQSRLVGDSNPEGYRRLVFRRGNVIVDVAAVGEETVKRLAGLLVTEVQKEMDHRRVDRR